MEELKGEKIHYDSETKLKKVLKKKNSEEWKNNRNRLKFVKI